MKLASFALIAAALLLIPANAAQAASPQGWIDSVEVEGNEISVTGWAADSDEPGSAAGIHIYVDGSYEVGTTASLRRPDVDAATGLGANHGFQVDFAVTDGLRNVCVYAIDRTGDSNRLLGCRNVQVGPVQPSGTRPVGWLDSVVVAGNELTASGWAADPDEPDSPAGIHIYVDGRFTAGEPASQRRADVAAATGLGANHGFRVDFAVTDGLRNVCVYAIDRTGDSNRLLGCRKVQVGPVQRSGNRPIGRLGFVRKAPQGILVAGWAGDPDTSDSIGVHVYANGRFLGGFVADDPRADVNKATSLAGDHGFRETLEIGSGWHRICVYGIDQTRDRNTRIGCETILLNLESDKPIERVSRFTTYFDCCKNRVTNIRLIAREVDRTVVLPGETFSIDQVVGPRTTSGGYLPDGYLVNGQGRCCAVGGGVSQFGTTIHNAVFWGGYQVDRHKPHSGWISRYPLGIEATLVYSSIDYRFTNDTDTPVIIRTSSTGTSVTVEIWGNAGGWRMTGYHPKGSRNSRITVLDYGGTNARRVSGTVYGSAPGTVRIVRTLTQSGVPRVQTWYWTYVR